MIKFLRLIRDVFTKPGPDPESEMWEVRAHRITRVQRPVHVYAGETVRVGAGVTVTAHDFPRPEDAQ